METLWKKLGGIWNHLEVIIIIVLMAIVLLQRACNQPEPLDMSRYIRIGSKEYELLLHKRDTIWRSEYFIMQGDPIPGKTQYIPIPYNVDTMAVLKDYFSKRPYKDVVNIKKDAFDYGTVTVTDTVSQNKLYGRKYNFDIKIPTYTETIVVKDKPRNKVYIGGGINLDNSTFINSAYAGGLFQNKNDNIYGLNFGLSTNGETVTPFIGGSMYWKLKFKKQKVDYSKLDAAAAQIVINNLTE